MSESRPEKRKVEFIESYWTGGELGSDYQWNDNHGELVRCRNCKYGQHEEWVNGECVDRTVYCDEYGVHKLDWYCADGVKRDG